MREPIEGRLAKQATMTTRVTGQDFECGSALLGADHDSASMEVLLRGHSRVRIFRLAAMGYTLQVAADRYKKPYVVFVVRFLTTN